MDALKIAFETMFVGALARSSHALFLSRRHTWRQHLPAFSGDQVRATIVAVLVAACAYCLGAAVARLGQKFSTTAWSYYAQTHGLLKPGP